MCAPPVMCAVFRIKALHLTTKGQLERCPTADRKQVCSDVFLRVSVCDRLNMCPMFDPVCVHVCVQISVGVLSRFRSTELGSGLLDQQFIRLV